MHYSTIDNGHALFYHYSMVIRLTPLLKEQILLVNFFLDTMIQYMMIACWKHCQLLLTTMQSLIEYINTVVLLVNWSLLITLLVISLRMKCLMLLPGTRRCCSFIASGQLTMTWYTIMIKINKIVIIYICYRCTLNTAHCVQ